MLRLDGKVALVTGCGSVAEGWGNGRATAALLARQGAQVYGSDLHLAHAQRTRDVIAEEGHEIHVVACDATDAEQVRAMVADCLALYGRIDVLVNNVGLSQPGGPVDMDEAVWDAQLEVNLKSAFLTCKHVIPVMQRQGGGSIVNVSSTHAHVPSGINVDYGVAKAGVNNLTQALSEEFGPRGVRVNTVSPGPVRTPWWTRPGGAADVLAQATGSDREAILGHGAAEMMSLTTGRLIDPQEIADVIVLLCSPRSASTTGSDVIVDAGLRKAV